MEKIENSRAWECNQAHVVQEFIECAIDRRPGREAGRCLQTQGKGAKLESCKAAKLRGRADGRNVRARVTERRGSGRGRSREGVHVQCITTRGREGVHVQCTTGSDPERPVHRGRFRPFPRVKSRRSLSTFRTNYGRGWGFFRFFLILLLFIYFMM